jgi:hypothetical protein
MNLATNGVVMFLLQPRIWRMVQAVNWQDLPKQDPKLFLRPRVNMRR